MIKECIKILKLEKKSTSVRQSHSAHVALSSYTVEACWPWQLQTVITCICVNVRPAPASLRLIFIQLLCLFCIDRKTVLCLHIHSTVLCEGTTGVVVVVVVALGCVCLGVSCTSSRINPRSILGLAEILAVSVYICSTCSKSLCNNFKKDFSFPAQSIFIHINESMKRGSVTLETWWIFLLAHAVLEKCQVKAEFWHQCKHLNLTSEVHERKNRKLDEGNFEWEILDWPFFYMGLVNQLVDKMIIASWNRQWKTFDLKKLSGTSQNLHILQIKVLIILKVPINKESS